MILESTKKMNLVKGKQYALGLLTISTDVCATRPPAENSLVGLTQKLNGEDEFVFASVTSCGIYLIRDAANTLYQYSIFQVIPQITIDSNFLAPQLAEKFKVSVDTTLVWTKEGRKLSVDNFGETPGISQAISIMKMSI